MYPFHHDFHKEEKISNIQATFSISAAEKGSGGRGKVRGHGFEDGGNCEDNCDLIPWDQPLREQWFALEGRMAVFLMVTSAAEVSIGQRHIRRNRREHV